MRSLFGTLIVVLTALSFAQSSFATTTEELDNRLYNVEKSLKNRNPVLPMDAQRFRLGGLLTQTHSVLFNENNTEQSFNSIRFEILMGVDITPDLDFFTAFGIISESELLSAGTSARTFGNASASKANKANKVPLIISHGTWKANPLFNLRFGRFVAPVGIINIEHFPPGLFLETPPSSLRPVSGGAIWGHFLNGVDVFGNHDFGKASIEYHLNVSAYTFIGPSNLVLGTNVSAGDSTRPILGTRLAMTFLDDHVTVGTSFQNGLKNAGNITGGADLLINWGRFNMKNEYVFTEQKDSVQVGLPPSNADRRMYYLQPSYSVLDNLRLVYRYDWFDGNHRVANNEVREHTIGLNWLPVSLLRVRTEFTIIDYKAAVGADGVNADYTRLTTTAVLSF